jgi:hypothetical protein
MEPSRVGRVEQTAGAWHDVVATGESVSLAFGAWALPGFVVIVAVCVFFAFRRDERP